MKRIIMFVLLFAALKVAGQTTGYLRFDTVRIMKQNGTCELYLINKTKDSLGLLTNVGGGLTRFIKPKVLNDSTVIIGLDTLTIKGGAGGGASSPPANVGAGYRRVTTPNGSIKTEFAGYGIIKDSTTNANAITDAVDTVSANGLVTRSKLKDSTYAVRDLQEQLYGVIYNKNTWTNTSDFTTANVTANVVSNKIEVTPSADGTYTAVLSYTPPTSIEHYKIALKYKVGTITGTSAGVGIGGLSINTYSNPSNVATIGFLTGSSTNKPVKFQANNATGTFVDVNQTAGGITASANDYILLTFERDGLLVRYSARNLTTNSSEVSGSYLFEIGPTPYLHNTARYTIYANGGSFTIDSLAITSTEVTRASIMFIGDSKTVGAVEYFTLSNRFANLVGAHVKSFVVSAGGGDRTAEVLARINEIIALRPKVVMLGIGSNDKRSGASDATYESNYQAISTALIAAGIDVYYLLPFYETGVDLTSQRSWILATFAADKIIDTWTPATIPGSIYTDNVHLTDSGHVRAADAILQAFKIREGRKPNTGISGTDDFIPIFKNNTIVNGYGQQTGSGASATTIFNSALITRGAGVASIGIFSRDNVDKYAIFSETATNGLKFYDKVAGLNRMIIDGTDGYTRFTTAGDGNVVAIGRNAYNLGAAVPVGISAVGTQGLIWFSNGGAGTDLKLWDFTPGDDGTLHYRMGNDIYSLAADWMLVKNRANYTHADVELPAGALIIKDSLKVNNIPTGSTADSVAVIRNNVVYKVAQSTIGGGGDGIYGGNGTLPSNVTVTGANNSLTFNDIFAFRVNSDYNAKAKANGIGIYTEAIIGAGNQYWIGYTPTAGTFSKGVGIVIDTNENVGMGVSPPTTMPLYATGASTFIQGLQSNLGNFYKVSNATSDFTANLSAYFYTLDATGGNITVTLPAASTAFGNTMGIVYKFQRTDNSGNTVTIQRAGSDTINGTTSFTLTAQYQVKQVQCTSTSAWAQW